MVSGPLIIAESPDQRRYSAPGPAMALLAHAQAPLARAAKFDAKGGFS
jgi:hypothetical protein